MAARPDGKAAAAAAILGVIEGHIALLRVTRDLVTSGRLPPEEEGFTPHGGSGVDPSRGSG